MKQTAGVVTVVLLSFMIIIGFARKNSAGNRKILFYRKNRDRSKFANIADLLLFVFCMIKRLKSRSNNFNKIFLFLSLVFVLFSYIIKSKYQKTAGRNVL